MWLDAATFAKAVHEAGAPLDDCWGFVDGTARPIARPVKNQSVVYSGHKRYHCLKFQVETPFSSIHANNVFCLQCVTAPNGLIAHMYGPIAGRRHDAYMLRVSGLENKLATITKPDNSPYIIYGDPAYGLSRTILAPYRGCQLTTQQKDFNKAMSSVRVSVEWTLGKIVTYFSYLDFKRSNKVLLQPIGKYYLVAALLTNCHTCLYGSQTSTFFGVDPPSLETYLSNS